MIVLDTDHLSCLEWGSAESAALKERLAASEDQAIVASVISYEEQTRGWMAHVARVKKVQGQVASYSKLKKHLQLYCSVPLLDFTDGAAGIFTDLRSKGIRIGTMDLKIASICIDNDALLLTRNSVDFQKVPKLRFEIGQSANPDCGRTTRSAIVVCGTPSEYRLAAIRSQRALRDAGLCCSTPSV